MDEPTSTHTAVPDEGDLISEAYRLAAVEGGSSVIMLMVGIGVLWRWMARMLARQQQHDEDLQRRLEAMLTRLIDKQADGLAKVESAVIRLQEALTRHDGRIDRLEESIRDLGGRIRVLEGVRVHREVG